MTEPHRRTLARVVLAVMIIHLIATAWLVKTVLDQNRRIQTLENHDKIQQSVDNLNSKFESLKSRVEGVFR